METKEFQVDLCVLVVATYEKNLGLHYGKELPTEREFGNSVDHYGVAMKNDFSDDVPLRFENSFKSDLGGCYIAKYSKYKHCMKTLARKAKSHETN